MHRWLECFGDGAGEDEYVHVHPSKGLLSSSLYLLLVHRCAVLNGATGKPQPEYLHSKGQLSTRLHATIQPAPPHSDGTHA